MIVCCKAEDTETDYGIGGGSDDEEEKEDDESRLVDIMTSLYSVSLIASVIVSNNGGVCRD